jgi:hypothetical protein
MSVRTPVPVGAISLRVMALEAGFQNSLPLEIFPNVSYRSPRYS